MAAVLCCHAAGVVVVEVMVFGSCGDGVWGVVIMVIIVMVLKSWSVLVAFLEVVELAIVVIIECWGSMWFGKNFLMIDLVLV